MRNNFDRIAPFYDLLVRLVFGRMLGKAASRYLGVVTPAQRVLVVGGGTGRILDYLPDSAEITYLELSSLMLEKARARQERNVTYIQEDFIQWQYQHKYDVIVFPFFLDVFGEKNLDRVIEKTKKLLDKDGLLLVSDFQSTSRRIHQLLLKLMHLFFRLVADLESRKLLEIRSLLTEGGFLEVESETYSGGLIFSCYYRLSVHSTG